MGDASPRQKVLLLGKIDQYVFGSSKHDELVGLQVSSNGFPGNAWIQENISTC